MELSKDLREFVELLNANEVEYLVVGAHALAFHGHPRYTGDLDFYVRASQENGEKLEKVVRDFGFASTGLKAEDFNDPDVVVQLGIEPNRIDIITKLTGIDFNSAWELRVPGTLDGLSVFFISRDLFLENKRASGRPKDLQDADALSD